MKKYIARIWILVGLLVITGVLFGLQKRVDTPVSTGEQVFDAAVLAGHYLVNHITSDGLYAYRVSASSGETLGGYNMLRHAGTTYSLLELYAVTGDEQVLEAAQDGLRFITVMTQTCFGATDDVRCVVDGEKKVKLGGNALAILAYTEYAEVTGDTTYIPEAEALAQWILGQQSNTGEYTRHIEFIDTGELDDHVSAYYPGEAIFALAQLYEATGEEAYLRSAQAAADWLIQVRDTGKTLESIAHDHWLLYGLEALYTIEPKEMYLLHAQKIANAIVLKQNRSEATVGDIMKLGAFHGTDRTTPAATRLEGLIAAHRLFAAAGVSDNAVAQATEDAITLGMPFLLHAQLTQEDIDTKSLDPSVLGGFPGTLDDDEIRIDYVQHALSALLGFRALGLEV